jgi:hypothetical protein
VLIAVPGAYPALQPTHTLVAMLVPNQQLTVFAVGPKIAVGKKTSSERCFDEKTYCVALPQLNGQVLYKK